MTLDSIRQKQELKLRIAQTSFTIRYIKESKIDFDVYLPTKELNLQRDFVWSDLQKQELIMSIILGRKINPIAFIVEYGKNGEDDFYEIIDGKQRLSTIIDFMNNKFQVELEGKKFYLKELDQSFQVFFNNFAIEANWIRKHEDIEISDQDKIDWFNFINFAGTPQDAEHKAKLMS